MAFQSVILWFVRNIYLVIHMTKMYFSVGACPGFLPTASKMLEISLERVMKMLYYINGLTLWKLLGHLRDGSWLLKEPTRWLEHWNFQAQLTLLRGWERAWDWSLAANGQWLMNHAFIPKSPFKVPKDSPPQGLLGEHRDAERVATWKRGKPCASSHTCPTSHSSLLLSYFLFIINQLFSE